MQVCWHSWQSQPTAGRLAPGSWLTGQSRRSVQVCSNSAAAGTGMADCHGTAAAPAVTAASWGSGYNIVWGRPMPQPGPARRWPGRQPVAQGWQLPLLSATAVLALQGHSGGENARCMHVPHSGAAPPRHRRGTALWYFCCASALQCFFANPKALRRTAAHAPARLPLGFASVLCCEPHRGSGALSQPWGASIMRPALLVAAWTVCACLRGAAGLVRPSELYLPAGQQIALLPDALMVGVIEDALQGVESAESCAEKCRDALPACSFFAYCKGQPVSAIFGDRKPTCLAGGLCSHFSPPPPPLPSHSRTAADTPGVSPSGARLQPSALLVLAAGRLQYPRLR